MEIDDTAGGTVVGLTVGEEGTGEPLKHARTLRPHGIPASGPDDTRPFSSPATCPLAYYDT
jgi:hypothetical protein